MLLLLPDTVEQLTPTNNTLSLTLTMRPLFAIIGLTGSVMMLTGIIGLSHKPSQGWAYNLMTIGLFSTSFSGAAVIVDDLTNRSHP